MKDVNINEQVLMTLECLRPDVTSKNIMFSLVMFAELWTIRIEPGEIQKTLAALLDDSCESLPCGGRITIETANVSLDSSDIPGVRPDLIPGEYVMLSFCDTGSSLSAATNMRFIKTLHEEGQPDNNTPATPVSIYEFIRKSGGDIIRCNNHGSGTTVSLFFPRYKKQETFRDTLPKCESSAMKQLI